MTDAEQRALAILLAEKAMKWPLRESGDYSEVYPFIWLDGSRLLVERDAHRIEPEEWHPAADVAQAIECAEKMQAEGYGVDIKLLPVDHYRPKRMSWVNVTLPGCSDPIVGRVADTPEAAISLAIQSALEAQREH